MVALCCALAPSALASSAAVSGGTLTYTGDAGVNDVTVTVDTGQLRVHDGTTITTGAGCTTDGGTGDALCTMPTKVVFDLGADNDIATNNTSVNSEFNWGAGNDTHNGGSGNDTFWENGIAGLGQLNDSDAHNGGAGSDDLVKYQPRGSAVDVTMADGLANDGGRDVDPGTAGNQSEGDNVASDVEDLDSGSGSDKVIGNALANEISGSLGTDTLAGAAGDDEISDISGTTTIVESDPANGADRLGGGDDDLVTYGPRLDLGAAFTGRTARVVVTADSVAGDGEVGEGDNVFDSVDNITGGAGNDLLVGSEATIDNDNQNTLRGGDGNDQLIGGTQADQEFGEEGDDDFDEGSASNGADTFNGGNGTDTANYSGRTAPLPLSVSIGDGANDGQTLPSNEGDNVQGTVENLRGGAAGDTLSGDAGPNKLAGEGGGDTMHGNGGNDTFDEGAAANGADTMNGGPGTDLADYSARTNQVSLTLDSPIGAGNDGETAGAGEHDSLNAADIEDLKGGSGADVLTAQAAVVNNRLVGGLGDDTVMADAGDDDIQIRDGIHDTADCGPGNDVVTADEVGVDTLNNCGGDTVNFDDLTAPAAPDLVSTTPASPSNDETPMVNGTAEPDSTVNLYLTSDCTGTPAGQGTADGTTGTFSIEVTVPENQTSQIRGTATDAVPNTSSCSAPISYTEDSTAPGAPVLSGTNPTSPSSDNNPKVLGSAEGGSQVSVYQTTDCTGPATPDSAEQLGSSGIQIMVPSDTTTSISATTTDRAGNSSGCSNSLSYTEDSTAPNAPALTGTTPASPSGNQNPTVHGTAEPNSTVKLYLNNCTGSPAGQGTANGAGNFSIQTTVATNQTNQIRASATDGVGNVSGCSAPISYTHDSAAPNQPVLLAMLPAPPANNNNPTITASADAGTTVRFYLAPGCAGAPVAQISSDGSGFTVQVPVPDDAISAIRATATDAVGNVSACSNALFYTEDSTAPQTTLIKAIPQGKKAARRLARTYTLGSSEPGNVSFTCRIDTGPPAPCGTSYTPPRLRGKHTLSVTATDRAGNVDPTPAVQKFGSKKKRKRHRKPK